MKTLNAICDAIVWLVLVAFLFLCLVVAAHAKSCKNDKTTKKDTRTIQHDGTFENSEWKCIGFGFDARQNGPIFLCTNKVTGGRWLITVLPDETKR